MNNFKDMDEEIEHYKTSTLNNSYQNEINFKNYLPWYYSVPWLVFVFIINFVALIFFLIGRQQYQNGNKTPLYIGIGFSLLFFTIITYILLIVIIYFSISVIS